MTLFLASVRDADEAGTALANGADIIDAKDPAIGAMGALSVLTVRQIVGVVAGRRPVSAVLGDASMNARALVDAATALATCGLTYLKVGIFPSLEATRSVGALAEAAAGLKLIAVVFADRSPDPELLEWAALAGFHGIMIDTADKAAGRLLDQVDLPAIAALVERARSLDLEIGLAGSLEAPDVPRLLPFAPDFLGFRRALCGAGGRESAVSANAVRSIRALIPRAEGASAVGAPEGASIELLAGRHLTARRDAPAKPLDRIFVRDFVVAMKVGAYDHEHTATQRIRFNVDADIAELDRPVEDMGDVVSYDVITDAILLMAAREHVALVETLAERIASFVLALRRVVRVTVRVEKLDLHPGSVGVEITREPRPRAASASTLSSHAKHAI